MDHDGSVFQSEGGGERRKKVLAAIIVLCIAAVLFGVCIGLFAYNIGQMRKFESEYVKIRGVVVDVKTSHSSGSHRSGTYYYYVISYEYKGKEYTFTDNVGRQSGADDVGKYAQIYVNPKNPQQAVFVYSSGSVSIFYSCCFCFFAFAYVAGMNILLSVTRKGMSFIKRLLFIWLFVIALGIILLLSPHAAMPELTFAELFSRIDGSVGMIVVCSLVALCMLADFVIVLIARSYSNRRL